MKYPDMAWYKFHYLLIILQAFRQGQVWQAEPPGVQVVPACAG